MRLYHRGAGKSRTALLRILTKYVILHMALPYTVGGWPSPKGGGAYGISCYSDSYTDSDLHDSSASKQIAAPPEKRAAI